MTSITKTLFNLTSRQMAAILIALAILPILVPIGLPIPVGVYAQDFYNEVEKLNPGDVVALAPSGMSYKSARSVMKAFLIHAVVKKGAKVIFYSFSVGEPVQALRILEYTNLPSFGKQYGTDYVVFPYLSGEETALAAIGRDLGVLNVDVYGTVVEDLPIMTALADGPHSTLRACALCWNLGAGSTFPEMWVRQWPATYGVRGIDGRGYQPIATWYGTYVFGALIQTAGWAEYEKLTGTVGEDLMKADVVSVTTTFVIALVIIANIGWIVTRGGQKKPKVEEKVI